MTGCNSDGVMIRISKDVGNLLRTHKKQNCGTETIPLEVKVDRYPFEIIGIANKPQVFENEGTQYIPMATYFKGGVIISLADNRNHYYSIHKPRSQILLIESNKYRAQH